ncbi:NADH-quinone oxidoreductase subunit N [Candidatus Hepatincolaceae symbiont of Richtersius coronifer]
MVNISISDFVVAIPEIYLILVAFIMLLFGMFQNAQDYNNNIIFFNKLSYISVIVMLLTMVLIYSIGDTYVETFNSLFIISPLIYIFKLIIVFLMVLICILSRRYLIGMGFFHYEYIVVLFFFLCGNLLMISSNDFISFYVALELTTISTYVLIFINKSSRSSNDAGIKYFLLGALGTGFLLYGISLIYGFTGFTNFIEVKRALGAGINNWIVVIGLVLIIIGLGFKLSLVPFHMWTPDVYSGVHSPMTLLLSTVSKVAILFIFIRILWEPLLPLYPYWKHIIQILIIASALIGFIASIYQTNIKSFIAYSSIANMAYMLMPILVPSAAAAKNIIIYVLAYSSALIGFFGVLMLLKKDNKPIEEIYDLKGISVNHPYLAFMISTFLISMAGLPITAGFFGKIFILYSILGAGSYYLAGFVALLSVVIVYFYLKVIKIIYFDTYQVNDVYSYTKKGNLDINITVIFLFIFSIGFILFVSKITNILDRFVLVF